MAKISLHPNYTFIDQKFPNNHKQAMGAVFTSFSFIETMFSLFDEKIFTYENYKWCDLGCGTGYFSIVLYYKLMNGLETKIPDKHIRSNHILENMLFMIDIQEEYIHDLKLLFGDKCHIYCDDVLTWEPNMHFDVIIGNPPFHLNHIKQVPTNHQEKSVFEKSKTIWPFFVKKGFHLLRNHGYMNMIIPSLWCKYDSYGIYDLLVPHLKKLKLYNNTQVNMLFHYQAQTPCSIFLAQKNNIHEEKKIHTFEHFDTISKQFMSFSLYKNKQSIPMNASNLCLRLFLMTQKYGSLEKHCVRSNMPSKKVSLSEEKSSVNFNQNIHSCILEKSNGDNFPTLVYKYSNIPCVFHNKPKLVLAHKMYGFPYYDKKGEFGISNRDNYIIYDYNDDDFLLMQSFTSSLLFIFLLECFKYRMKMIEPTIIDYIPNIANMEHKWNQNLTNTIEKNDEFWFSYFSCTHEEKNHITSHFSKKYMRIPIIDKTILNE
tara:strand:+ start:253 stop:1707 length:1455 start_codon:yes stop_codon:yes gene_type:complete